MALYFLLPPVGIYLSDRRWSDQRFSLTKIILYFVILYLLFSAMPVLSEANVPYLLGIPLLLLINSTPAFTQVDKDRREEEVSIQTALSFYFMGLVISLGPPLVLIIAENSIIGNTSLGSMILLALILIYKGIGVYENWPFLSKLDLSKEPGAKNIIAWAMVGFMGLYVLGVLFLMRYFALYF